MTIQELLTHLQDEESKALAKLNRTLRGMKDENIKSN